MVHRGEIYWMNIKCNAEHINNGTRPVLVVSNDLCNKHSPVVHVVPLTTAHKRPFPLHVECMINGRKNTILCESIFPINSTDLENYEFICKLPDEIMKKVSNALMTQLGIEV